MDGWLEVACVEVGVAERSAVGGGEDEVVEVSASARQVFGQLVSESSGELDTSAGVGLGWSVRGWPLGAGSVLDAYGWSIPPPHLPLGTPDPSTFRFPDWPGRSKDSDRQPT